MKMRRLGLSELYTAPLAFGGNVFGWTADEAMSFRLLDAFVDAGLNLVDTADIYSTWVKGHTGGESETILGRWIQKSGKRDKILVATKVGMEMGGDNKGLSKRHIRASVEASLKRLQTDRIDLYQAHIDDPTTPLEETLETFDSLVREGKVRALGASNYSGERLNEALKISKQRGWARYETLQPRYSLCERKEFESEMAPVCGAFQVSVIGYSSLASGFLSGKYRNPGDLGQSVRGGAVQKYLNERGLKILKALDGIALKQNSTPSAVALAWLMNRPTVAAPIVSATNPEQFQQLLQSLELKLDPVAMEWLDLSSR